jgi:mono/diheme cytochrome c family protein
MFGRLAVMLAFALGCTAAAAQAPDRPGPMQSGQHVPGAPAQADSAKQAPAGTSGKLDVNQLFATSCGWCHFNGGRQDGKGPKLMGTPLTDAEIVSRIRSGKPGQMPAFGATFSDEQMKAIVAYIRGLKP